MVGCTSSPTMRPSLESSVLRRPCRSPSARPPTAAYGVAVGVGLGIILWASSRAGRTYKESLPRFVRPIPVAQQGGFAGKTALLVSGSPRLALVELRHAL